MSLISTLCSPDAESYESVEYADEYFSKHPDATRWAALPEASKETALKHASEILDKSLVFHRGKTRFLYSEPWKQRFRLPSTEHLTVSGTATSGTTTEITCADLTVVSDYRDDYFNGGTIRFTSGSNIYNLSKISDFVLSTGTITVESAFSNAVVSGDEFVIVMPLDSDIRNAVCEMALEVMKGDWQASINAAVLESGGMTPGNLLPAKVLWLLGVQNFSRATVRRT